MGELGKRIQLLRRKRQMTVRELAEAVHKSAGYLSRVEARDEIPSPELICALSEALLEKPEVLLELAKSDLLGRATEQIEAKNSEALSLFRRSK
jgi:transcriptional regulator with XRE-family HTH domain